MQTERTVQNLSQKLIVLCKLKTSNSNCAKTKLYYAN